MPEPQSDHDAAPPPAAERDSPFTLTPPPADTARSAYVVSTDGDDGRIYAEGAQIFVAPKRCQRTGTISLGGPIATAQDEATAAEIARRCHLHDGLLAALRLAVDHMQASIDTCRRAPGDIATVRQAIALAEGR